MPDYMRAKFCEVIIGGYNPRQSLHVLFTLSFASISLTLSLFRAGLFVDVGSNYSVVEHCITAFDYDSVGSLQKADQFAIKDLSVIFPVLRDWIYRFLTDNSVMVSVDPERNVLLTNVSCDQRSLWYSKIDINQYRIIAKFCE